jgi:pimeloyl-ACP methyl ester carboxylesterase
MNVYFLSGLGADERAFKRFRILGDAQIHHLKWPKPEPKEKLEHYCNKVASLIDNTSEFSIIGFSFGGMVTVELLKTLNPKKAILISSVRCRQEMPGFLKFFGKTGIDNLLPSSSLNRIYPFAHLFTGLKDEEDKRIWADIIRESDPYFVKWAIHEVLNWRNEQRPENVFHIHGNKDKTFPVNLVKADQIISGGGHFMVLSHAKEISDIINKHLGFSR